MASKDIFIPIKKGLRQLVVMKNGTQQVMVLTMPFKIDNIIPSGNPDEYIVSQTGGTKSYISIVSITNGVARIKRTQMI
jgi:hypothetical protein